MSVREDAAIGVCHLFAEVFVIGGVFRLAEQAGDVRQKGARAAQRRRPRPLAARLPLAHVGHVGRDPVAELHGGDVVPDILVFTAGKKACPELACLDVPLHGRVHGGKDIRIAVGQIHGPGHEDAGVAPEGDGLFGHGEGEAVPLHGHRVGDAAVPRLFRLDVFEPFLQKSAGVKIIAGGGREQGDVARPAHALVALRAVGGDIDEVRFAAPDEIALQLVEPLVRAGKAAALFHIRIQGNAFDAHLVGGDAADADVAEAHIRHAGHVHLGARAADIGGGALCRAQKGRVQLARFRQNFRMADDDLLPRLCAFDVQAHHAGKVLAHVVNDFARGGAGDGDGRKHLVRAHGRAAGGFDGGMDLDALHGRRVPVRLIQIDGGVVRFAVVKLGKADVPFPRHLPGSVGAEDLFRAVCIADAYLRQKRLPRRGDAVFAVHDERPHRPAAGDDRRQRVAFFELRGDVVHLILQIVFIRSKPGSEKFIADLFAVQLQFVDTQRRCVDARALHLPFAGKNAAECERHGRGLFFGEAVAAVGDPLRRPGGAHAARFKSQPRRGGLTRVVLGGKFRRVPRKGAKGFARIGHVDLPAGSKFAARHADGGGAKHCPLPAAFGGERKTGMRPVGHAAFLQMFASKIGDTQHVFFPPSIVTNVLYHTFTKKQVLHCKLYGDKGEGKRTKGPLPSFKHNDRVS